MSLRVYLRRAAVGVRRLSTRGWVIAYNLLMANGINTATPPNKGFNYLIDASRW